MSNTQVVFVLERDFGYEGADRISIHRTLRGAMDASGVAPSGWAQLGDMWETPDPEGRGDGLQITREEVED